MEKILFIVPPVIRFNDYINPSYNTRVVHKKHGNYGSVLTDMPLGVLALSAYVKNYTEVKTRLIDFNIVLNKLEKFKFDSFVKFFYDYLSNSRWLDYNPSIIGISSLFVPSYQSTLDIAQCCREIFPNITIVAGGGLPTNMYKEIFKTSRCFDALCYGEGEKPLLGLVKTHSKSQYFEENNAWITEKKVKKGKKFQHDFIKNLDEIPFYDYEICQPDDYGLNPAITAYNAGSNERKQNFHVMTSRGCPHRCCFCSSHTIHGRRMRYYSVNRVRKDFERLKNQYGAKTIIFQDDNLMANILRAYEIINIVKELQITAIFQNGLSLYALNRKMLKTLKSAVVNQLILSVESGSDRVLRDIMHKPLNLLIVKQVVDNCRDLGIYTNVNILIGLPGETKQDIEDTRSFLKTLNANWFMVFCATPLVGSEMYQICKEKNYLKESCIDCDFKKAIVETEDFTAEYIQEKAYFLNLELNFAENSDFRLGNYKTALMGFENAIRSKEDHAIAYYYAAKCYDNLGNIKKAKKYMTKAKKIVKNNTFWRKYVDILHISM